MNGKMSREISAVLWKIPVEGRQEQANSGVPGENFTTGCARTRTPNCGGIGIPKHQHQNCRTQSNNQVTTARLMSVVPCVERIDSMNYLAYTLRNVSL